MTLIKRPFVGLFMGLVLGIILFNHFNNWIVLGSASIIFGALLFMFKNDVNNRYIILGLTIVVVLCGYGLGALHTSKDIMVQSLLEQSTIYRGILYGMDHPDNDRYELYINEVFHNNAYNPIDGRLKLIVLNKENVNLNGQVVEIEKIRLKDGRKKNSVDFDYDRHLKSQGFDGYAYVNPWSIKPLGKRADGARYQLHHMRNEVYTHLRLRMTKEDADLGFGMLLGESSFMERELKDDFVKTGIAHVLAMSGLHFGILYGVAFYVRKKLRIKGDGWRIAVIILLWFIAMLNGLKPSALRAVTMLTTLGLAPIFSRKYDPLNVLAMIGVISIMNEPLVIYQVGFQLSYVAVLSIVLIVPILNEKLPIPNEEVKKYVSLILGIQLGIAPVIVYHFNYLSLVSIIVNIPATALTTLIVPIGYFYILILRWIPLINSITIEILSLLFGFLKECSMFLRGSGLRGTYVVSPFIKDVVLYGYFIVLISCEKVWRRWIVGKHCKSMLWILMIPILLSVVTFKSNDLQLTFWDVGQGDSTLVDFKGVSMLIDTGEEDVGVYMKLLKSGVKPLDYLVLSHTHSDHAGGAVDILNKVGVKHLVMGASLMSDPLYNDIVQVAKDNQTPIIWLSEGDVLNLSFGLTIECLGPDLKELKSDDELNDNSVILLMTYGDIDLLFTGDLEKKGEENLLRSSKLKTVEILKVPHHGSENAAANKLLERVNPQTAIIQVGPNLYGHPNRAIIDLYENSGVRVYRTDRQGAITVKIQKDYYEVIPFIDINNLNILLSDIKY